MLYIAVPVAESVWQSYHYLHGGPMQGWASWLLAATATVILVFAQTQASQPPRHSTESESCCQPKTLPDEYSVVDRPAVVGDDIARELERARQYYLRGLAAIERRDTLKAAKLFESAMDVLNQLASTPGIERNDEYSDLAQSIIEDYENFIRPIDELEVGSPLFVMRDRLFQAVEIVQSPVAGVVPTSGVLSTTVPLVQNEYVNNAIAFLTNTERGRTFFKKVLARMNRFFPLFRRIAREEGVPEELIHLAIIESGLDPNAVSRAKAVGLWQFIESTGSLYQLRVTQWYDHRRDPERSTRAAMRHLRDLYQELGDWHLVLAAYNCGINCVRRAIKQSGVDNPTYWRIRDLLPRETRGYVPMYIAATLVAMQAEAYGFRKDDITLEPEWVYDTVTVGEPISLTAVAQCAMTTLDTIKALNPELVRNTTPPGESYTLRIPLGRTQEFTVRLAMLSPEEKQPWVTHTVQRGETLAQIAERYDVPLTELADINGVSSRTRLRRGQEIRIPLTGATRTQTASAGNASAADSSKADVAISSSVSESRQSAPVAATTQGAPAASTLSPVQTVTPYMTHRVRRGETLAQIADDYGTTVAELRRINRLRRAGLVAGQVLKVPNTPAMAATTAAQPTAPSLARKITHRVRRGENISMIAALYGVRQADVIQWNPRLAGGIVKAGEELSIYVEPQGKGSARATPRTVNRLPKWYTVRWGDTIYSIARRFGVDIEHIMTKNKSLVATELRVGQRLRLQ
ncbi:MAG: LysM peptidoglycan-binding domain-containing protein [Chlorobi bacterium]|nr:LysM peptidoglycan-binding domain-containing protein [Chlorobiota bacterium]